MFFYGVIQVKLDETKLLYRKYAGNSIQWYFYDIPQWKLYMVPQNSGKKSPQALKIYVKDRFLILKLLFSFSFIHGMLCFLTEILSS